MNFDTEFVPEALQTEAPADRARYMLDSKRNVRLLHGAMGCVTESAELMDALKKHIFYSRPLDNVNVSEEIGDMMWYIAILCNELDLNLSTIMNQNIAKLRARYPDKFTEFDANNRDLAKERATLENKGE